MNGFTAWFGYVFSVLTAVFFSTATMAIVMPITAEFRPDPANPSANRFVNTTSLEGSICSHYQYRAFCQSRGYFSLRAQMLFISTGPIAAHHTNPRQGAMLQVHPGWKNLSVTSAEGKSETLRFRVSGVSTTYKSIETIMSLVEGASSPLDAHNRLWTGGATGLWDDAPAPCVTTGSSGRPWARQFLFFWMTPTEGLCAKTANFDIPYLEFWGLDFAYELDTPKPLSMESGTYTGSLLLRLGPGGDIDAGDILLPTDDTLQLDFTLKVDHIFKVEVPPGGNQVELIPEGGWQNWLRTSRRPERLFRDQTFNLWTSTAFKMQLQCDQVMGNTCGIRNAAGHQVPLDIGISLPGSIADRAGQQIRKRPLLLDGSGSEFFQPSQYVDRRPGTLHFEVRKPHVEEMFSPANADQRYSGNATVVWDSEV